MVADELARYAEAEELIERSLAFSAEHSLDGLYLPILAARAGVRLERGDWAGALSDATSVLALGGETGPSAVLALVARGRILAARGEPEAGPLLDQAARAAEGVGDVSMLVPVADARSEYFLWAGDADRAQREARQGLSLVGGSSGPPFIVGRLAWRLWRAGGSDERPSAVAEPYRLMIEGDWAGAAADWAARGRPTCGSRRWPLGTSRPARRPCVSWTGSARPERRAASGPLAQARVHPTCRAGPAERPPPTSPA